METAGILRLVCVVLVTALLSEATPLPSSTPSSSCVETCTGYGLLANEGSVVRTEALQTLNRYDQERPVGDYSLEVPTLPEMKSVMERRQMSEVDLLLWHKSSLLNYQEHFVQLMEEEYAENPSFYYDFKNQTFRCERAIVKFDSMLCGKAYQDVTLDPFDLEEIAETSIRHYRQRKIQKQYYDYSVTISQDAEWLQFTVHECPF